MNLNDRKLLIFLVGLPVVIIVFFVGVYVGEDKSYVPNADVGDVSAITSEQFQPYWKVWHILDEKFVESSSTTPQQKIYGSIQGLASSYGDPYTVFFPPVESKNFEEEISGSFGGGGMEIGVQDGLLTIIAPLKNTPASYAGVLAGDQIISIGEKSALKMTTDEAIKLIRGEIGTSVTVTFARAGVKEPIVKTLVRAAIEIPTVNTKLLPENIFVIELYNFSATSPNLFRSALREFVESGSDKLVLDLRNNPGGFLEAALDMASWFLPTG